MPSSAVDIQASIPDIPTYFNHVVQNVPTIGVQRSLQHVPQTSLNIPSMIGEASSVVTEAANTGTECSIEFKEEMDTYACTENKDVQLKQAIKKSSKPLSKKQERKKKAKNLRKIAILFNIIVGFCGIGAFTIGVWNLTDEQMSNWMLHCVGAGLFVVLVVMVYLNRDSLHSIPLLTLISTQVEFNLEKFLKTSLLNNYLEGTPVALSWNKIQIEQQCCGVKGIDDYKFSVWKNSSSPLSKMPFPNSCCVLKDKDCGQPKPTNEMMCKLKTEGFYHKAGCLGSIMAWYERSSMMTLGVLGSQFVFQVICFVLVFKLSRTKAKDLT